MSVGVERAAGPVVADVLESEETRNLLHDLAVAERHRTVPVPSWLTRGEVTFIVRLAQELGIAWA